MDQEPRVPAPQAPVDGRIPLLVAADGGHGRQAAGDRVGAVGYGRAEGNGCECVHPEGESCGAGAHGKRNVAPCVSSATLRMRFFSRAAALSCPLPPQAGPASVQGARPTRTPPNPMIHVLTNLSLVAVIVVSVLGFGFGAV